MKYINKLKKIDNYFAYLLFAILILWPLYFIPKGIDYNDTGYYLSHYKYFFSGDINPNITLGLSNFFGGLFFLISPEQKLLFFRVLDWIFNSISISLLYFMLRDKAAKSLVLSFVLMGSFYIKKFPMTLSYNTFSYTLYMVALFLMYQALTKKSKKYMIFAGLVIGFNVFFRVSNAFFAISVLVPFWYFIFCRNKKAIPLSSALKDSFSYAGIYSAFGLIGLSFGALILLISFGPHNFISEIQRSFLLASGNTSHSFSTMLPKLIESIGLAFEEFLNLRFTFFVVFLAGAIAGLLYKVKYLRPVSFLIAVGVCLYFTLVNITIFDIWTNGSYIIMAFVFALIGLVLFAKIKPNISLVCAMLILYMLSIPLGSNIGLIQFVLSMYFLLGTLAVVIYNLPSIFDEKKNKLFQILNIMAKGACYVLLLLLFVVSVQNSYIDLVNGYSYGEKFSYNLIRKTSVPALEGMHSNYEKTISISRYYKEISKPEYADNPLIAVADFSMAYTLTDHKPYLRNILADYESLKEEDFDSLMEKAKDLEQKPIIAIGDYRQRTFLMLNSRYKELIDFAEENNYTLIEDKYFRLYLPKED